MKICMMTNTYLPHVGGVARSVSTFADEYRKLGHDVLVVAPEFDGPPPPPEIEAGVERVAAVSFSQIQWPVTTVQESAVHNALPWTPTWDTAVVELATGRNAPYRGFKAPTDLLIWAQNKPQDALPDRRLKGFRNAKQVLWNTLYDENLKALSSHIQEEFHEFRQSGSIWISGQNLPEIAAVFLALSAEGYKNVKIVLPADIKPWL